jgi:hypothetical protein
MCEEMNIVKLPKIGGRDSRLLTARNNRPELSNRCSNKKENKAIVFSLSSINENMNHVNSGGSGGSHAVNNNSVSNNPKPASLKHGANTSRFLTIN